VVKNSYIPFLIIGGGPTGLGAASRLQELGAPWVLLEKNPYIGGLSASFQGDGFTWDLGAHVLFSHYQRFDQFLNGIIPDEEWRIHRRASFVRSCQRWVPYPFQYNIGFLPLRERWQCLRGLISLCTQKIEPDRSNFQRFIETHFGEGIATLFLLPYNHKVWVYPLHQMNMGWLGGRVPLINLERVTYNVLHQEADTSWGPNHSFRYPLRGGIGEIWSRLAARLPEEQICLTREVVKISASGHTVTLKGGQTLVYDILINTMPLDLLVKMTDLNDLAPLSKNLHHSSTIVIGLGLRFPIPEEIRPFSWMYFPEGDCPFYRAAPLSNYTPYNTKEGHGSLILEISDSPYQPLHLEGLLRRCVKGCLSTGLIEREEDVVHHWQHRMEYGYPIPNHDRDHTLAHLLKTLETTNIFSRGRFGAWKYEVGNMDHSYMQGVEVVDRILLGSEEVTVWNPDKVNGVASS
jgi:protoporphyrinogen oxidase